MLAESGRAGCDPVDTPIINLNTHFVAKSNIIIME
jgi:hypothetical protein